MVSCDVTVNDKMGLHSKNATKFIQLANEYTSSISVEMGERKVNAKSLLGVLSLGIREGMTMKLTAEGADEQDAIDALKELVETDFSK